MLSSHRAIQELSVQSQQTMDLGRCFSQQFNSKTTHASLPQIRDNFGRALSDRVEQSVAAANVSNQRMIHSCAIPQFNLMLVTWTTAIRLVGSW